MIAGLQAMLSKWLEGEIINQAGKVGRGKSDKEGKRITGVVTNPHHFMWLTPPLFRDLFYVDLPWKVLWVKSVLSKCNFEGCKLEERMLKIIPVLQS